MKAKSSAWYGLENSPRRTELPYYAVNAAKPDDAFYTDRATAAECLRLFRETCGEHGVAIDAYVEPSAGDGSFLDLLPAGSTGLDLFPRAANIIEADFLTWYPSDAEGKQYAVVGNPPFGHRGATALAFLKRSLLFAAAVGFILPMSFHSNGKGSNMKRAEAEGARLVRSEKLPPGSFRWPETGKPMAVNTVFQVWLAGRGTGIFTDYDVSEYADIYTCSTVARRRCGLDRGRRYDCFIAGSFYDRAAVVENFDDVLYGSGYGFVIHKEREKIMRVLAEADWSQYCSDSTHHCKHVRLYHCRKVLGDAGFGRKL